MKDGIIQDEHSFYIYALKTTIAMFTEMPLIGLIITMILMILPAVYYVLEDLNYHNTFAGMPRFMWPTKQYWRENKHRYKKLND